MNTATLAKLLLVPIEQLTKSHRAIANYILAHLDRIPYCTEEDIAGQVGVSAATVSRFWRAVGFDNLKAFKKHLLEQSLATPADKMQRILGQVEGDNAFRKMVPIVIHHLEESVRRLSNEAFEQAVRVIAEGRKLYLHGAGSAAALVELASFRLNRIGIDVEVLARSGHELYEKLVHVEQADVILLFAFVQSSPESRVILEHATECGCRTIVVTDLFISEMVDRSDITLQVDRGDLQGFHSMAPPVVLIDSLAVAITGKLGKQAMQKLESLHQMRKKYAGTIPKR